MKLHLSAEDVARLCVERGVKFTPLRRQAFETLAQLGKPATAYDLLRAMREKLGRPVAPPTAYRALTFLQKQGFVLRIESLSAYLPASAAMAAPIQVLCLCRYCGAASQLPMTEHDLVLSARAADTGFRIGRSFIELLGTCADCDTSGRT